MLKRLYSFQITIFDLIIALLMSCMFAISPQYIASGKCVFTGTTVLQIFLYFVAFLVTASILRMGLKKVDFNISFFQKILNHKYALLILALLMFLLWIPTLIILYPGTVINDTWGQFSQFVYTFYSGDKIQFQYLGDHHPVLTTFIMGWLIVPLANAIDNLQIALFVYALLQSLVTCLAFASSLIYMHRKLNVGSGFAFISFLLYAILPIFPGSAQTIAKDSLTAWIFVFFTISFIEIVRTKGECLNSAYQTDVFILLAWALCATCSENQGQTSQTESRAKYFGVSRIYDTT